MGVVGAGVECNVGRPCRCLRPKNFSEGERPSVEVGTFLQACRRSLNCFDESDFLSKRLAVLTAFSAKPLDL